MSVTEVWFSRCTMRLVVSGLAKAGTLKLEFAPAIAAIWELPIIEVTAEMMKHLSEGDGK